MRPISSERFVQILAKHREWDALARYARLMADIDRLARENPGELVKRGLAMGTDVADSSGAPGAATP